MINFQQEQFKQQYLSNNNVTVAFSGTFIEQKYTQACDFISLLQMYFEQCAFRLQYTNDALLKLNIILHVILFYCDRKFITS